MRNPRPLTDESGEVRELLMKDIRQFRRASDALAPALSAKLTSEDRPAPSNRIMSWFDGLEAILEREAKLTGLFGHNATIGQAREFLVSRVLKTILPSGVQIGNGQIIDYQQRISKQVDIVIYDPRFPMMKLEGGGLYFVEGVLATVEVKSSIDSGQLIAALDNCRSVLELNPVGEHPEEAEERIRFYMERGSLAHSDAEHRFGYMFRPATYVFGFNSKLSFDTMVCCVKAWWDQTNCAYSAHFPLLPRVIVSGKTVGFTNDGRIRLNSGSGADHVMSLFQTPRRFRWLALHLMDTVSTRLGLRNFAERFDYRLSDYYPFDEYLKEIKGTSAKFISRG